MPTLSHIWDNIQRNLFPELKENLGELTEKQKQIVKVIELLQLEKFIYPYEWRGRGRPPASRMALAKSFIAKSVLNICQTTALLENLQTCPALRRLCGFETKGDIPSEPTFSRAFDEFSDGALPQKIHELMVIEHLGDKLFGHISRDGSAIEVREKPHKKEKQEKKESQKRGRPSLNEVRPVKEKSRIEMQADRSLEENIADLPTLCDVGTKRDSKGYKISWNGYKIHADGVDGDIPVAALLTSASTHDSQAAIPLAQISRKRVTNLYDLMDSAYDSPQIYEYSRSLGHVPIIDNNPRRGEKIGFNPAQKSRFKERSTIERIFSNLKDNFGISKIYVRGAKKVMAHLMFAIVALTATQIYNLLH